MKTRGFLIIALISFFLFILYSVANFLLPQFKLIDDAVYNLLSGWNAPLWLRMNEFISFFGSSLFLFSISAVLACRVLFGRYVLAAIWVILSPGMGLLLNASFKVFFDRERPLTYETLTRLSNQSYPSGHVVGAIVFLGTAYWALTRLTKKRPIPLPILVGLITAICLSRVFLGAHWIHDVVGGIFFGSAWLFTTIAIADTYSLLPLDEKIPTHSL